MFNNIKKIRKAAKMTQDDLAKMLGVQRPVISKYETGAVSPSLKTLEKIASALNVGVRDLLVDDFRIILEYYEAKTPDTLKTIIDNTREAMADYIPREAVLKLLEDKLTQGKGARTIFEIAEGVRDMPAADVEKVKRGEWERKEVQIATFGVTQVLVCTNCGYDYEYDDWFDRCPNCGAKMDGGKE